MAPTTDEELRLRLYNGDLSHLGPAEQFLKVLVDIPFAFQRLDALLFMASLPEEASALKESFSTLEVSISLSHTSVVSLSSFYSLRNTSKSFVLH